MSRWKREHGRSLEDPRGFWAEAARDVHWDRSWEEVLDGSNASAPRWFRGGRLNTCHNALDVHVAAGHGDRVALVHDSPVTGRGARFTYAALLDAVARFAGGLARLGVAKGDRVVLYLPMVPEAVIAMLACARLGAVHSVVFGGFAPRELATRITDAKPRVVVSASAGIEPNRVIPYKPLLDEAIRLAAHAPDACVILQRPEVEAAVGPRDVPWESVASADPAPCTSVEAEDPLYILYTSGTTGPPKGVVRDNGGHAVAMKWSLRHVYGMRPGDVFWAASDIGWVVGHSYIVYAPLLLGCTTVLYEGKPVGTPDAGAFWRVVAEHRVNALFTAPTALRAIRQRDPAGELVKRHDLSSLATLFLAGEHADPATVVWAREKLGVPVVDHWWQTETGWPIASGCVGLEAMPIKPGSVTKPVPGWDVRVVDARGAEVPALTTGDIVVKLPLPPGCFAALWNDERRFAEYFSRYPGHYETADAGYFDQDGYLFVMARTDDIINVAGHRLSTGAIEEVVALHPEVAECSVIGVRDALKGEVPVGLVVLAAGARREEVEVVSEVVALVREKIGAVACFRQAAVVERLPKTRSGKVLRKTMRKIANGEAWTITPTIEEPKTLDEMADALRRLGYPRDS